MTKLLDNDGSERFIYATITFLLVMIKISRFDDDSRSLVIFKFILSFVLNLLV